jgi:hypothetical protein
MERIPFRPEELEVVGRRPSPFPGAPDVLIHNTPITHAENYRAMMRGEKPLWMADTIDVQMFCPKIIPDNVARGFVVEVDGFDPNQSPELAGGPDMFGVEWVYVPVAGGSMVKPGNPKVPDITEWEDYITFPDLDSYDWAGSAERNRDYLNHDGLISIWVMNGLFERLISFVDMQNALIAMVDEDEQEAVHRLFDRLCDFYADLFAHYKKYYNNDIFYFHDDWGSQNAPFFSLDTVREMLLPYLKRIVQSCHDVGCIFEFHSCGKNEMLVSAMIEAGCDAWSGQPLNDFAKLHAQYGDQIHFEPYPAPLPKDATEEQLRAIAREYVDTYASGTAIMTLPFSAPSEFAQYVYEYSRIAYCGKA